MVLLRDDGSPDRAVMPGALPGIAAVPVFDIDILMRTAAGDRVLASELMSLFITTAEPIFSRLTEALQAGDCAASQHESHAMAGAAGLIGASAMIPILKEIEALSLQRCFQASADLLPELALAFASVIVAVTQALQDSDAAGRTPL